MTSWFKPLQCTEQMGGDNFHFTFSYCFGKTEVFAMSFVVVCLLTFLLVINCREKGRKQPVWQLPEIYLLSLCLLFETSVFFRNFISTIPEWLYALMMVTENITQSYIFFLLGYVFVNAGVEQYESGAQDIKKVLRVSMIVCFIV